MTFRAAVAAVILSIATGIGAYGQGAPTIEGCPVFPPDNIWNRRVDNLPKALGSDILIGSMQPSLPLYPDFGAGLHREGITKGIPYVVVPGTQKKVSVDIKYDAESDGSSYPVPPNPPIEGGADSKSDRHILMIDKDRCRLYELFASFPTKNGKWRADSGSIFELRTNKLRPDGWTSGDAAGLPVFPALVRYDEVMSGEIQHALRFTVVTTRDDHIWPARHQAGDGSDVKLPPMGLRLRLKADYPIEGFSPEVQVILRALKKYGMMLADNGPAWDITGTPDERWNNEHLKDLSRVHGSDFEVVYMEPLMINRDSGQARQ